MTLYGVSFTYFRPEDPLPWAALIMDWEWPPYLRFVKRHKFYKRHERIYRLERNLGLVKEHVNVPKWLFYRIYL